MARNKLCQAGGDFWEQRHLAEVIMGTDSFRKKTVPLRGDGVSGEKHTAPAPREGNIIRKRQQTRRGKRLRRNLAANG
jgi:hypothetical protein